MGVVIDGCPANLPLTEEEINEELALRRPGRNAYTSPRQEEDRAEILSGVFEGKTTGAPISLIIPNNDADSSKYDALEHLYRPGHANFTYLKKYGIFDHRGGGRASARETVCRVAAGAIAKKLLKLWGIDVLAYVKAVGKITAHIENPTRDAVQKSAVFCPDPIAEKKICNLIASLEDDSVGGVIEMVAHVPAGLGDPVYEKLEANLAKAMLCLPASKGIEFGDGFEAARMRGSEHNDLFCLQNGEVTLSSNHAGGTLGGISTGQPLVLRVAFKPTSSIKKPQQTVSMEGEEALLKLPPGSRHDPCVALRAAPIVEAMGALVLVDSILAPNAHLPKQSALLPQSRMKPNQKPEVHTDPLEAH